MKNSIWILILGLYSAIEGQAVENRPSMRRACLNRLDSTIDIQWFKPIDNCLSFTHFDLYGRDNALALFQLLGTYTTYSTDNISFKLPNLKDWEFYLVYHKACNGTDSIFSDTISIDNTPPVNTELDSVSVDLTTQKTIIGWKNNPSSDVKGYIVYHVTGTNSVISSPQSTYYHDLGSRDPSTSTVSYSVAATDSCNNSSLISTPHSTMYLQTTYNQCNKTIDLSWGSYVGWPVDNYLIYRQINSGAYELIGSVVSNILQFTYNFNTFGDSYCFYIRAIKQGEPAISSSSNKACVSTGSIIASRNSYIAKASVQNSNIDLTLVTGTGTSLEKINIFKAESSGGFAFWQTINTNGGVIELTDNNVNVQTKSYRYFFTTEGPCQLVFDSSQIAKTILLNVTMVSPGNQELSWSLYDDFIKSTEKQELLLSNDPNYNRSSTWNTLNSFNNTTFNTTDNTTFSTNQEQICYCMRAIENNPVPLFNRKDTSYSNIVCVTADPIVYFPNAIQINGYNNTFAPKGVFIDYDKSTYQIYNRWGEIIYETSDIRVPWTGSSNNTLVHSDIYMYRATIIGINGKTLYFDGTITVLR